MAQSLLFVGALVAGLFAGALLGQWLFDSWGLYLQRVWLRTRVLPQGSSLGAEAGAIGVSGSSSGPSTAGTFGTSGGFSASGGSGIPGVSGASTTSTWHDQLIHLREMLNVLTKDCLRHGVPWLSFAAKRLLRIEALARGLSAYCKLSSNLVKPQALCEVILAALLAGALLSLVLLGSPYLGVLLVLSGCAVAFIQKSRQEQKRQELLQQQLPDALDALGACFNVGFSIPQAFESVAQETPNPLGDELKTVVFDINAGRSIQEALAGLDQRSSIKEMRFIAAALEIKNRTGGSFKSILEGASQSVQDALELKRSLAVQTAQARLSARIVTLMPLGLLLVVTLADRDYLNVFFSSFAGLFLLCIAVLLEVVGIALIRRILNIGGD